MTIAATSPTATLPHPIILWIAQLRAWVFLILLIVFFEIWARAADGDLVPLQHLQHPVDLVFATAPLLLALGQTFVIISAGIDLSLGFVMGLSSVIAAHASNYFAAALGLPPFVAMLVGDPVGDGDRDHSRPRQRAAHRPAAGPAVHRHARHVRRRARRGLSLRRRHDGRHRQRLVQRDRQRPDSRRAGAGDHHRRRLPRPALHAVADALRPAHLRARREQGRRQPRRHQHQGADAEALPALGRHGRRRRRDVHRPLHRRRGAGGRAAAARIRSPRSSSAAPACSAARARSAGTVAGALVIAVIQYGLVFINVEPFWQFIAVGVVIIVSVLVDQTQRRLLGGGRQVE